MNTTELHRAPDIDLVRRWKQGDMVAASALVKRVHPLLWRYFNSQVRNNDQTEDLVQTSLEQLTRSIRNFKELASFRTFLFRIVRNVFNEFLRNKYKGKGVYEEITSSIIDVLARSPSSYANLKQNSQRMLMAMDRLPIKDRSMLESSYWLGMSGQEIGAIHDLTAAAVRAQLKRARKKLREKMDEIGLEDLDEIAGLKHLGEQFGIYEAARRAWSEAARSAG